MVAVLGVWSVIDVRDVASAVAAGLTCPDPGHVRLLLCADDISSADLASRDLARKVHPDVPWRGGPAFENEPVSRATRHTPGSSDSRMGAGLPLAPITIDLATLRHSHRPDLNCRRGRGAVVRGADFNHSLRVVGARDHVVSAGRCRKRNQLGRCSGALVPAARFAAAGEPTSLIAPSANCGVVER